VRRWRRSEYEPIFLSFYDLFVERAILEGNGYRGAEDLGHDEQVIRGTIESDDH